jgi:hypothetical protein
VDAVDRGQPLGWIEPDARTTLAAGGSRIEVEEQPVSIHWALPNDHSTPRSGRPGLEPRSARRGCTVVSQSGAPAIAPEEVGVVLLDLDIILCDELRPNSAR